MSSTRGRLIKLLQQNKDTYISGQHLSEKLGISRTAVWKHMNELKKDGYEIEGIKNKGYKILQFPNKVSENTIKWGLKTNWLGKSVIYEPTLPTTQTKAHELARAGAEHGTIVVADEQTDARGRMGRTWTSKKDQGISLSIILRPNILPYIAPQLTLLTATVIAQLFDQEMAIKPQIKWPNDVLINEKKISGILTEMQAEQDYVQYVIIGIGINVQQKISDFPEELAHRSTSLFIETNRDWSRRKIIQQLLELFERKYEAYIHQGFSKIKKNWEHYGFKIGKTVRITEGDATWEGIFLGIDKDGALQAKTLTGEMRNIYSAQISWFEGGV